MSYEIAQQRIDAARQQGSVRLNLSGLGLQELPPELFAFTQLRVLWLSDNQLTRLPPEVGALRRLEQLRLNKNALTAAPDAPLAPAKAPLAAPVLHTQLTLVETAEPELLEELLADRRVGPLLVARLSDCVAVVAPGNAKEVQRWLLKAGHTPRIVDGAA